MNVLKKVMSLTFFVLLSACAAKGDGDKQMSHSGFLSSYDDLTEVDLDDDSLVMRYLSPELKSRGYNAIMLDPLSYYPEPTPSDVVSKETLAEISRYSNDTFALAIRNSSTLATEPDDKTIRLKSAITELNIVDKELSGFQYIPIAFLVTAASGKLNDMVAKFTIEVEIVDSLTGESLGRVIKTGFSEELDNEKSQLSIDDVKPLLDAWRETMEKTIVNAL